MLYLSGPKTTKVLSLESNEPTISEVAETKKQQLLFEINRPESGVCRGKNVTQTHARLEKTL